MKSLPQDILLYKIPEQGIEDAVTIYFTSPAASFCNSGCVKCQYWLVLYIRGPAFRHKLMNQRKPTIRRIIMTELSVISSLLTILDT